MLNYLKMSRGEKPTVKGIFDPFNYYGKTLGLTLLISLFVTLWSLLLIVPGIIKAISYSQALLILAENPEKGVFECLNESKAMMDGYKMDFFVLGLSFILWDLGIVCTFGILGIYAVPYMEATYINFYLWRKGQNSNYIEGNFTDIPSGTGFTNQDAGYSAPVQDAGYGAPVQDAGYSAPVQNTDPTAQAPESGNGFTGQNQ